MTRFFCPRCRADSPQDLAACPRCGLDIHRTWRAMDRVERLLSALGHREANTRVRAAWLLGEAGDPRAVAPLAAAAWSARDPYLARTAAAALGAIGGAAAVAHLEALRRHPARMVRRAAAAAMSRAAAPGDSG